MHPGTGHNRDRSSSLDFRRATIPERMQRLIRRNFRVILRHFCHAGAKRNVSALYDAALCHAPLYEPVGGELTTPLHLDRAALFDDEVLA